MLENLHFHGRANHHVEPRKRLLLFEKTVHSASSTNYPGSSTRGTAGGGIPWNDRAAAVAGEEFVDHNRDNLLSDLSDGCQAGPIEMELNGRPLTASLLSLRMKCKSCVVTLRMKASKSLMGLWYAYTK